MKPAEDERMQSRERLSYYGAPSLGDAELVGVLLGTGSQGESAVALGARILQEVGGLRGLGQSAVPELAQIRGVGVAKAARIVAAAEFGRRSQRVPFQRGASLLSSIDVDGALRPRLANAECEHFIALPLDARNRPLGELLLSKGGLTGCFASAADIYRQLIRWAAANVIFVHNHPSGQPDPSPEDIALTRQLRAAGELLGIRLLDHVIIAAQGYFSFADEGLLLDPPEPCAG